MLSDYESHQPLENFPKVPMFKDEQRMSVFIISLRKYTVTVVEEIIDAWLLCITKKTLRDKQKKRRTVIIQYE